jgi:hypothetical protein
MMDISFVKALGALLVAPILPCVLFALILFGSGGTPADFRIGFLMSLIFAELQTLVLGLPAIIVLRNRVKPRLRSALIFGGMIASLPWLVLGLLPGAEQASLGGAETVIDGQLTWFGFWQVLKFAGLLFLLGVVGGAIFWLIVVWPALARSRREIHS